MSETPIMKIYCDGRGTHKRATVATFDKPNEENGRWGQRLGENRRRNIGQHFLAGDEPSLDLRASIRKNEELRQKFHLYCRKCSPCDDVNLRAETLYALCDRLAANGVSDISLAAFAGRVSTHTGQ